MVFIKVLKNQVFTVLPRRYQFFHLNIKATPQIGYMSAGIVRPRCAILGSTLYLCC